MQEEKIAIVTGASRGIGAAAAQALARAGATALLAVRDPLAAGSLREEIIAAGGRCEALRCDVADAASARDAVDQAMKRHGRIDIVVNNAGAIAPIGLLADTDPAEWVRTLMVNLAGAYHMCHAALPHMVAAGQGVVINVSTGAAHAPREGWSAYCSSKAGLWMLTRSLALEYESRGIAAFGLQPGLVDTPMQAAIRASGINDISRVARESLASPKRPASVIAWLALNAPADLRGQDLSMADAGLRERCGLND